MSNLSNDLLQRVMTLVPLTATGPVVSGAIMTTIISNSYYYLMDTLNQMKSLKLKDHPDSDAADCHDEILVNVESLESAGAFKPEHLGYISFAYLRILLILDFKSGLLRNTRRLWSLLRNLYCVTKTSCTLMILLPMVYSIKNICKNIATMLTQSKLISRADAG